MFGCAPLIHFRFSVLGPPLAGFSDHVHCAFADLVIWWQWAVRSLESSDCDVRLEYKGSSRQSVALISRLCSTKAQSGVAPRHARWPHQTRGFHDRKGSAEYVVDRSFISFIFVFHS